MTKSKKANKKFNLKNIASGVFPGEDTIQQSYQALEKKR